MVIRRGSERGSGRQNIQQLESKIATGRPKTNPYPQEKKFTVRIPENVHRMVRMAAADSGRTMVEIAVEAFREYLKQWRYPRTIERVGGEKFMS